MANDYIGAYSGAKIDELLGKADTQVYTKAEVNSALAQKVDAEAGMGLSQESYTTAEKEKLYGLSNYDDSSVKANLKALASAGAKNLLRNNAVSQTINGIEFTVGEDGSITATGTATANADLTISNFATAPGRRLVLSGCPEGGGSSSYRIQVYQLASDYGEGAQFTTSTRANVYIRISAGYSVDGLVFHPMLRDAAVTDPSYEPFAETNLSLTKLIEDLTDRVSALEERS